MINNVCSKTEIEFRLQTLSTVKMMEDQENAMSN